MIKTRVTPWDSADYLKTDEDIIGYLNACLEEAGDDAKFIAKAIGIVARARGMSEIAKDAKLGRESLYKALSENGNPSLDTVLRVLDALGLTIKIELKAA